MTVPTLPATTPADEPGAAAAPSLRASESAGGALAGRLRRGGPFGAIWIATVVLFALSPLLAAGSVSRSALLSMLPFAAILAIAALGQTLVVQQGGLDLSVPGTIALAGALTTKLAGGGTSLLLTLLVIAGVAIATGLLIGFAITRLRITPLVATLGSNALLLGVVLQVTGGSITNTAPQSLTDFAQGKSLGIPHTALIALALVAVVAVLTRKTVWGRRFEAVGANPRAARAAGINVTGYQVGAYVGAALCYAAAGVPLLGRRLPAADDRRGRARRDVAGRRARQRRGDRGRRAVPDPARAGRAGDGRRERGATADPGSDRRVRHGPAQRALETNRRTTTAATRSVALTPGGER
jgi:ribose transport system permease protein